MTDKIQDNLNHDDLLKHCECVEKTLADNSNCTAGVFGSLRAYVRPGWIDSPELLALLGVSDPHGCNGKQGFWYGYIGPKHSANYENITGYVALIVRLPDFLNSDTPENIFLGFNNAILDGNYFSCRIQEQADAYIESDTFPLAVEALINIIQRFSPALRNPGGGCLDPIELRTFNYLGFRGWF